MIRTRRYRIVGFLLLGADAIFTCLQLYQNHSLATDEIVMIFVAVALGLILVMGGAPSKDNNSTPYI